MVLSTMLKPELEASLRSDTLTLVLAPYSSISLLRLVLALWSNLIIFIPHRFFIDFAAIRHYKIKIVSQSPAYFPKKGSKSLFGAEIVSIEFYV